jgi:hypothetical protein
MGADTFSVCWTGQVQPLYSETYTFKTTSDDGVRLWVNGQQIIDNWTNHAPTDDTGTIALSAGVKYDITLEYYENGGGAVIQLYWSSASQAEEIIPQMQLYSSVDDTEPPTPNPAVFAWPPAAASSSAISMTATTGSDATGPVEYLFDETSGNPGATDSGWQTSASYTDSGLDPSTQYTYTVQMRDALLNTGTASSPASATTAPAGNYPPAFTSDPINEINATEDAAYSSTIADDASDPESDPMTFSKVSGASWLSVAADGTLSGTPTSSDVGLNVFTVRVDATGGFDTATLNITVTSFDIVKWGEAGGDTEILTDGVNTAGQNQFPAVYNPATLVNPPDGTNGYDVDVVGRTNEFSGAFSNTNTTPVFVNNAAGDYMQLVYNGDFTSKQWWPGIPVNSCLAVMIWRN